jgi:hypothetical protein
MAKTNKVYHLAEFPGNHLLVHPVRMPPFSDIMTA